MEKRGFSSLKTVIPHPKFTIAKNANGHQDRFSSKNHTANETKILRLWLYLSRFSLLISHFT